MEPNLSLRGGLIIAYRVVAPTRVKGLTRRFILLAPRPLPIIQERKKSFHGGIEDFLHNAAEAMNLVNEQDVTLAKAGQNGGHVPRSFDGGTGSNPDVDVHFLGYDVTQSGLPQAWRPVYQDVVQGLFPHDGGPDGNNQVFLYSLLANKVFEQARPKGGIQALIFLPDLT